MRKMLVFTTLLLTTPSFGTTIFASRAERQAKRPLAVTVMNECHVSDTPDCRARTCLAVRAAANKIAVPNHVPQSRGGANPAALLCGQLGAEAKTFVDDGDGEISYCVFKDGSFADGWDLMRKLHPAKPAP